MPNTIGDFWNMAVQTESSLIVALCSLEEKGTRKCEQYWPNTVSSDGGVALISSDTLSQDLVMRRFKVNDQIKTQLHYTGWPDHGVPSGASMESFGVMIDCVLRWQLTAPENERAIVHCSAGVGRTGTTIALTRLILAFWAQKNQSNPVSLSVFGTVRRMREQRCHMV